MAPFYFKLLAMTIEIIYHEQSSSLHESNILCE